MPNGLEQGGIAAASLLVAAVYVLVGWRLGRRPVSPESRLASAQFSTWWVGLGGYSGLSAVLVLLYAGGALPLAMALTLEMVSLLAISVFLWGLVGFLVYVYSGRYHLFWVSAFFAAFYVAAVYYTFSQTPNGVGLVGGVPTLQYSTSASLGLALFVVVGILGPELVGAVLYLSLLRRTNDRTQRYRIWMVGGSILLWFALELFVSATTTAGTVVRGILELLPALMALAAYYPPRWVKERLRVEGGPTPERPSADAVGRS